MDNIKIFIFMEFADKKNKWVFILAVNDYKSAYDIANSKIIEYKHDYKHVSRVKFEKVKIVNNRIEENLHTQTIVYDNIRKDNTLINKVFCNIRNTFLKNS